MPPAEISSSIQFLTVITQGADTDRTRIVVDVLVSVLTIDTRRA